MERRMEMKRLILLCGANGIGKSTASAELMKRLPHSSYIDSDYCRMTNPPIFNEELIRLNYKNILAMMENSFACGEIQNVIFPFGFHGHRKQLFDALLEELRQKGISLNWYQYCCTAGRKKMSAGPGLTDGMRKGSGGGSVIPGPFMRMWIIPGSM